MRGIHIKGDWKVPKRRGGGEEYEILKLRHTEDSQVETKKQETKAA